jgi:hypothetical protein
VKIAILRSRGIRARYGGFETFAQEEDERLAAQETAVNIFLEVLK